MGLEGTKENVAMGPPSQQCGVDCCDATIYQDAGMQNHRSILDYIEHSQNFQICIDDNFPTADCTYSFSRANVWCSKMVVKLVKIQDCQELFECRKLASFAARRSSSRLKRTCNMKGLQKKNENT